MVKKNLKSLLILLVFVLFSKNVFGYQILVNAFIEGNNMDIAKYSLTMSAYKKTKSYFNGTKTTYDLLTSNQYFSDISSFNRQPFNFLYKADTDKFKCEKVNGYATIEKNPGYFYSLPDYYSIRTEAMLFHTQLGTNYNGNQIPVEYNSYKVGLNGTTGYNKNLSATISPSSTNMGIVGYEPGTEYQFKVIGNVYYAYHKINITDNIKNALKPIATRFDGGVAVDGRLYMSSSMITRNDAGETFGDGTREFTVNLNTAYNLLSLSKIRNGDWGNTSISGIEADKGKSRPDKSVVNTYDNIIQLGQQTNIIRTIYIQYIDKQTNNIMSTFGNNYANMLIPSGIQYSLDTSGTPFQELYRIISGEEIQIRGSDKEEFNGLAYNFSYGTATKGSTYGQAIRTDISPSYSFTNLPVNFKIDESGKSDYVVVRLYYDSVHIPPNLPDLELTGKLRFINTKDSSYSSATGSSTMMDFVPATSGAGTVGELTPYLEGAYPYVVRALKYEKKTTTGTVKATIKCSISYKYRVYKYHHNTPCKRLICTKEEHTHTDSCYEPILDPITNEIIGRDYNVLECDKEEHTHTDSCYKYHDGCGWNTYTKTKTISNSYTYEVPYTFTWYGIENLKIYRISYLNVYDNTSNTGGELFDGEGSSNIYRVNTTTSYNNRFKNSSGYNQAKINPYFPDRSYTLTTIDISNNLAEPANDPWNTNEGDIVSNEQTAYNYAKDKLDDETRYIMTTKVDLHLYFQYWNDYVVLDGNSSMVNKNFKDYYTWDERIYTSKEKLDTRVLDATKINGRDGADLLYTANLNNFMRPSTNLTQKSDFANNYLKIPVDRENGVRVLSGEVFYEIEKSEKYYIGTENFIATDYTYSYGLPYLSAARKQVEPQDFIIQSKIYRGESEVEKVNVFSPISLGGLSLSTENKIDHTVNGLSSNSLILQKNAEFTIKVNEEEFRVNNYRFNDTREFIVGYYYMCNFDIIYKGQSVPQGTSIYVDGATSSFTAKPDSISGEESVDYNKNAIKVVAVSKNRTQALKEYYEQMRFETTKYLDQTKNKFNSSGTKNQANDNLLTRTDIVSDGNHAAYRMINTVNIGRIFDFEVTDCTDLAWKDVFRKESDGNVNESTGVTYYSGIKRWKFEDAALNTLENRANIGTNPKRTLPLGPYKHTNINTISAPKIGYRISFDLKTTGYMTDDNRNNERTVQITPSYYYISKDGLKYINNIKLFYMNPSGKYVAFENSGYNIYFRPNDGYRYLRNSTYFDNYELMSKELEALDVSKSFTLTNKMMSTTNDAFMQAWYGEYKLPNSIIAVEVNAAGKYDINNKLTDGYIGVIFDILANDDLPDNSRDNYSLSYGVNNHSSSGINTSQWDYEGFLGFNSPGSAFSGSLKLENGIWNINNTVYNEIKGTVVLFDLDNRAADDFE